MMMKDELKPCPFCGGPGIAHQDSDRYWSVFCDRCDAETARVNPSESEAISVWNTRFEQAIRSEYEGEVDRVSPDVAARQLMGLYYDLEGMSGMAEEVRSRDWEKQTSDDEKKLLSVFSAMIVAVRKEEAAIRSEYKGEPVAWMYNPSPTDLAKGAPPILRIYRDQHSLFEGWTETPLYTHPSSEQAIRADERGKALSEAAMVADRAQGYPVARKIRDEILALKTKGQGDAD
jgi:Lar family restriction alleviation protein